MNYWSELEKKMNLEYEIVDKKDVNEYMNSLIIMIV